ncbi:MAG TPA: hypothetical protein VFX89_17440 [Gammaproteobacteria bacterium]|nr:hypothetical protein [Gammaproteobacteria bacterium]
MSTIVDRVSSAPVAAPASAVSWGAILAGGAAAAALSLVMLILGTGLGFAAVSPWSFDAGTATALGVSTIVWISVTQLLASGVGGYLAGRLRSRWTDVLRDEVYFRDTAHGFLAWCVASLGTAAILTSVIGSVVGTGVQAGSSAAGAAASGALAATAGAAGAQGGGSSAAGAAGKAAEDPTQSLGYFVDSLFRADSSGGAAQTEPSAGSAEQTANRPAAYSAEVARIFANGLEQGSLPADDAAYVGRMVAERTGLSQSAAQQRVNDTFAMVQTSLREAADKAKAAADEARKAAAYTALWLVVSLLIGAFVASWMATFGGRLRDQ